MRLDHVVDDWFMAKRCKACENILKPSSAMFLRCGMKVNKVLVVSFGSTSSSSSSKSGMEMFGGSLPWHRRLSKSNVSFNGCKA